MKDSSLRIHEDVQKYYGSELSSSHDLKTSACCSAEGVPEYAKEALAKIHVEVHEKFYGCGSPLPIALAGCTVLDLGCGTGRDAFVASHLVGETGRVIGVDMTDEQLEVARKHIDFHTRQFGYARPNIEFRKGYIEDLAACDIASDSVDVVISNCVLNLAPDKRPVFAELLRVLKPGGELYFSDVFASSRVPEELLSDPVLRGECLSGALYVEDFRRLLGSLGVGDYRIVSGSRIEVSDPKIQARIGQIDFYSLTVRVFKSELLEDCPEDYGQIATYNGTLPESPHVFALDARTMFRAHKPEPVSGNTAAILSESRYAPHFTVQGDRSRHFGMFAGAEAEGFSLDESAAGESGSSCC